MASPKPQVPLQDQCAVIDNDTLYVYSPDAFQSLSLQKKAKWQKLDHGVPVTGAACVKGTNADGDTMLYIVGGSLSKDNTSYTGLQAYSFSQRKWSIISPSVPITTNLRGHGATFLNSTGSILIYGGSQDSAQLPSTQSFTVSVNEPHAVQAYSCDNVPAVSPIVLPWDDSSAISIGGSLDNAQVYKFDTTSGWLPYATMLEGSLKSPLVEQAVLISGSDGSKVLAIYDLSVSPNTVSHVVLQDADGLPAPMGQVVNKRGLTLNNWPKYNAKYAPTMTRSGFSLAQDPSGLVVIAGGNDAQPVEIFDESKNSWVNTKSFFGNAKVHAQSVLNKHHTTTSTHSSTSTMSTSSSSTPSPTAKTILDKDHPKTTLILGATLGSVLGFIAILIIILLLLRYKRRQRAAASSNEPEDEKRLSFADRGASFMKEANGLPPRSNAAYDSMILLGNKEYEPNHRRSETRGSDSSTAKLVPKSRGDLNDAMELEPIGEKSSRNSASPAQGNTKSNFLQVKPNRSSGWSRYFSGTDLPSLGGSGRNSSNSRAVSSTSSHDCNTHGPTEIPPLNLGQQFTSQRVSKVVTGSLQPSQNQEELARSDTQKSTIPSSRRMRPRTLSSTMSSLPASTITDTVFTHDQPEGTDSWTPVTRSDWSAGRRRDTTTSSVYEPSNTASSEAMPQTPRIIEPSPAAKKRGSSAVLYSNRASYQFEITGQKGAATTAIPIPAGTAMVTAVSTRQTEKPIQSDMSWIKLDPLTTR